MIDDVELEISIHAPREGSDFIGCAMDLIHLISIHAPREGSDRSSYQPGIKTGKFLSTLPARGATGFELQSRAKT